MTEKASLSDQTVLLHQVETALLNLLISECFGVLTLPNQMVDSVRAATNGAEAIYNVTCFFF